MILMWVSILIIGVAAVLLIAFTILFKDKKGYQIRQNPKVSRWMRAHTAAFERQEYQNIFLGQHLFCPAYPGVGFHALSVIPTFLEAEIGGAGGMSVSAGDGSLAVLAQQIIQGSYNDGYTAKLHSIGVTANLYGPTPISFLAGMLSEMHDNPHHSVAFLGNYGPEALTMVSTARRLGGHVFVAAGSLISQATLFTSIPDLLIGEEIFSLPGSVNPKAKYRAGLLTEDILRIGLILALIVVAMMKLANLL